MFSDTAKQSKKKRFSEHKPHVSTYKISYSLKKNEFSLDRSSSIKKSQKLRLKTDYADHDYSSSNAYLKSNVRRSSNTPSSHLLKKKESDSIQYFNKQSMNLNIGKDFFASGVQSTKHDSSKNKDLKYLFNRGNKKASVNNFENGDLSHCEYQSKIKAKKRGKIAHGKQTQHQHNNSMFSSSNNGAHQPGLFKNHYKTPVSKQVQNYFISPYSRNNNNKSTNNGYDRPDPTQSKDKIKASHNFSLEKPSTKSTGKASQNKLYSKSKPKHHYFEQGNQSQSVNNKNHKLNLISKDNIKISAVKARPDSGTHQKAQSKEQKLNTFSNIKKSNKHSYTHSYDNANIYDEEFNDVIDEHGLQNVANINHFPVQKPKDKVKPDEQATVKTIKKQEPAHQSITRQLESSRAVTDQDSDVSEGFGLSEEEVETFGDRFPYGFEKVKLLGRGGFSLVWLGLHIKSGKQFAIKQIITNNTHQTHIKEIWFGTMFFTLGGVPKPEFAKFPGTKNLVRLYSYEINQLDTWIFYEKSGHSLGSSLYDIKSEKIYGDERLYKIYYKPIYLAMEKNPRILKTIVVEICKSLALLSECQVVHSDLKTENILLKYDPSKDFEISELKLIDYGSSFEFQNISQFSMATPEYMPPEILNYIIHENEGDYQEQLYEEVMSNYRRPWAVDIWSLGCVLLEIVVGVPLWMSLPLLVPNKTGKSFLQKEGLFAVKGRLFPQIIQKQRQVVGRLDEVLVKQNYSKIVLCDKMKAVLKGMLEIDFNKRISPAKVVEVLTTESQ